MSNLKATSKAETLKKKTGATARNSRKRDRGSTEERLLKAGTEIFSKYGFEGATTKMISKKSSVNESLIMRYFGGKEGLLIEIIRRFFEKMNTTPLSYPPQETLEAELIHYFHHSFAQVKKHNSIFRIMLLRASTDSKMRKKFLTFISMDGDPKLVERIDLLKAKGQIPPHVESKLVHMVAFQYHTTVFVADTLFEVEKQNEIQLCLEKLVSLTVRGMLQSS